ncbi:MAG: DUF2249 domain-containing protein [Gemmatimonadetes bacterium]|nr:DUF2249 domain-containing protein [Gemmatimonadota bacterium]
MTSPYGNMLPEFDPSTIVDLDVRDELAAGREPLPQILKVAEQLGPGQVLHLRSPFRPSPLSARLGHLGFASHSFCFGDDDWSTWFWKADTPMRAPSDHHGGGAGTEWRARPAIAPAAGTAAGDPAASGGDARVIRCAAALLSRAARRAARTGGAARDAGRVAAGWGAGANRSG